MMNTTNLNNQDSSYHRIKNKIQKSRLWTHRPSHYDKKKTNQEQQIPEYTVKKKKYASKRDWLLTYIPTNRVFDLKISLMILAVLFSLLFGILYYLYLKSKKII